VHGQRLHEIVGDGGDGPVLRRRLSGNQAPVDTLPDDAARSQAKTGN